MSLPRVLTSPFIGWLPTHKKLGQLSDHVARLDQGPIAPTW